MTATLTLDDPGYFDRLAEVEEAHWWSSGMWRLSARWLDADLRGRRGLRALDVGCGTGLTVDRLAGRPEVAEAIGLEPSRVALGLARSRRGDHPWVLGDALRLPFPAESFDLVTSFDVFQHLPEGGDRLASAELWRVLRPGGLALIRSNARGWSSPSEGDGGGTLYRLDDLAGAVASAGLSIRRSTYANCLPALAQELRGRMRGTSDVEPSCRSHPAGGGLRIRVPRPRINRLMGHVTAAEAFVAGRLGARLPFGHSTLVLAERPA